MSNMSKRRRPRLSDQIREAFVRSGMTRFKLAKEAGVAYAVVHRFISSERDITLETADKLVQVLELELASTRRSKGRRANG